LKIAKAESGKLKAEIISGFSFPLSAFA